MAARWLAESADAIDMVGSNTAQRQHGLDAFAGNKHVIVRHAKTYRIAKQVAHRTPRRVDRSFAEPYPVKSIRIKPCPMHTGDPAIEVGDAGNHRRPGLGRKVLVMPIVAARMEAQAATVVHVDNSPTMQIGLDHGSFDRLRHRKEASCRLLRSR